MVSVSIAPKMCTFYAFQTHCKHARILSDCLWRRFPFYCSRSGRSALHGHEAEFYGCQSPINGTRRKEERIQIWRQHFAENGNSDVQPAISQTVLPILQNQSNVRISCVLLARENIFTGWTCSKGQVFRADFGQVGSLMETLGKGNAGCAIARPGVITWKISRLPFLPPRTKLNCNAGYHKLIRGTMGERWSAAAVLSHMS